MLTLIRRHTRECTTKKHLPSVELRKCACPVAFNGVDRNGKYRNHEALGTRDPDKAAKLLAKIDLGEPLPLPAPNQFEQLREMLKRHRGDECLQWPYGVSHNGYGEVWHDGGTRRVHRVAWELMHGPIRCGKMVLHNCNNPRCFNPGHLWLGGALQNNRDCIRKGRKVQIMGEQHPLAKLTEDQVRMIWQLRSKGWPLRKLAARFKVSIKLVSGIYRGDRWKHLFDSRTLPEPHPSGRK